MIEEIRRTLLKAEMQVKSLRKSNKLYILISLISSVLATLIAGVTAVNGPIAGSGNSAWRFTCGLVAVFTATATVFTGLQKQFTISERLARATEFAGKLRSIIISMEDPGSDKKNVINEYRKVVEQYSEFVI